MASNSATSSMEECYAGEVTQSADNCQGKTEYITDNKQHATHLTSTHNPSGN